jgi:hypothetical protein
MRGTDHRRRREDRAKLRALIKGMNLTDEQRAALGMLAASVRGRRESIMLAHGFGIGTLRGVVRDGLATAVREPAYYNRRATLVTMMQITEAGLRAIDQ